LKAIAPLAEALNFTPQKTAKGIVDIVVANMVRAIRKISVERGHDPRDYALMPFGGAGPLHARPVAKALGISEVIVPGAPGILCAQGLLASDPKETMVISHRVPVDDGSLKTLDAVAGDLLELAHNWCEAEEIPNKFRKFKIALDMRFVGQNFELSVPVWDGQDGDKPRFDDTDSLRQKFFDAHVRVYGFCDTEAEIEVVNHRMSVSGLQDKSALNACPTPGSARVTPQRVDQVWFDGDVAVNTPVYWRPSLPIGFETAGPAIIEQLDATIPVYPGDTVTVDAAGNLLIKPGFPK
jgi:N-methylhydantoinase A